MNGPGGTATTGIDTWTEYTEYGNPRQTLNTATGGTTGIGYGWLGTKQRASLDTGLTLMGERVYNRATGLFTSIDPVAEGGDTAYSYPNDPIQIQDLNGRFWSILGRAIYAGCKLYCKRTGSYALKRWGKPAGRWISRQAFRAGKLSSPYEESWNWPAQAVLANSRKLEVLIERRNRFGELATAESRCVQYTGLGARKTRC